MNNDAAKAQSDALVHGRTSKQTSSIERLREIMRRLRDPKTGCPWDVEQTFSTIAPYTIEEAYEVSDAIERKAWDELKGELGDLLFQSVFHAQMAEEAGLFNFDDIADTMSDKMISRHPHVFGDAPEEKSAEQQTKDWEAIKAAERAATSDKGTKTGALDGVAIGLPALLRAHKLQNRAARVGFDWPEISQVLDKIQEEALELTEARDTLGQEEIQDEMGDLLFVMANLARHLNVEPEEALRQANAKFERRFKGVEEELRKKNRTVQHASLEEMEQCWAAVKVLERTGKRSGKRSGERTEMS